MKIKRKDGGVVDYVGVYLPEGLLAIIDAETEVEGLV